jgi:hypothetical protein
VLLVLLLLIARFNPRWLGRPRFFSFNIPQAVQAVTVCHMLQIDDPRIVGSANSSTVNEPSTPGWAPASNGSTRSTTWGNSVVSTKRLS